MRLLVLGGAWLLGRLVVEDAARRGIAVTVFNRGRGERPVPAGVQLVRGDRRQDEDLQRLTRCGPWEAVVDISGKSPAIVERAVRSLLPVAQRYVSVSTVSVYRDWPHAPVQENSPLREGDLKIEPGSRARNLDEYALMKVGCELAGRDAFGDDRLLVVRLHAMLGQYEDADPLLWWLDRMRRGGPLLVPAPDRAMQAIDVRDVSRFLVDQVEHGTCGVFNVGAPADGRTFGALLRAGVEVMASSGVPTPEPVWIDEDWLADHGVQPWTDVPLWHHAPATWRVSVDRAVAAGLRCRPLADTVAESWRWLAGNPADPDRFVHYGIDPARAATILNRWRATTHHCHRR